MGLARSFKLLLIIILLIFITCTQEQPYVPQDEPGKIVGVVKTAGKIVQIDLYQGILIRTTFSDSSGYFVLDSVFAGIYNLEFFAEKYGRQILNEVTVNPGQVTTIPDIYLKPYPEQITTFTPVDGEQDFPLTAPIQIQFSNLMDHQSVENNFSLVPDVNGRFAWEIISGNSKLSFYPDDQYFPSLYYAMKLTTGAKTSYNDSLSFNFESHFKTEGVKITSTIPENKATFIAPQTGIYVYFNSRMDPQSVEQSFSITPLKMGNFKWFDPRRVCFQPGSFLASNTQYAITIDTNAKDYYGNFLQQPGIFTFKTEPLRITSSYPTNGSTSINRSSPITITFNTYVNQDSVQKAFSLSPPAQGWIFQWSDLTRFQYTGNTALEANTFYTVTIDTICSDLWGNFLPSSYSFIFKTGN